ncbi:MAG: response regulator transcription factor, partial [Candidatus Halichondribacter symbioticus]
MSNLKKILLVDDDCDLREVLAEQLVLSGDFDVYEAEDGASALARAKEAMYDLVILDVGMPDMDGRELCRLLRKQAIKCPIVMLTAQDSDSDTIYGLDAGANDYISKPIKFPVLLARIRAQLRQHEHSEDASFGIGPYTFKPGAKMLFTGDNKKVR